VLVRFLARARAFSLIISLLHMAGEDSFFCPLLECHSRSIRASLAASSPARSFAPRTSRTRSISSRDELVSAGELEAAIREERDYKIEGSAASCCEAVPLSGVSASRGPGFVISPEDSSRSALTARRAAHSSCQTE
jgi:hypothetical protein